MINKPNWAGACHVPNRKKRLSNVNRKLCVFCRVFLLLLIGSFHLQAETFSQTFSLHTKSITLEKVFKLIEDETNYVVLYNYEELNSIKPMGVNAQNAQLNQFLDIVLKDLPLTYTVDDKTILISREAKSDHTRVAASPVVEEAVQRRITGRVVDEEGTPLEGVSVVEKGQQTGHRLIRMVSLY